MNKKKMLSLFLACCMLVGMIPAALAVEPGDLEVPEAEKTEETTPVETTPSGEAQAPVAVLSSEDETTPSGTTSGTAVARVGETDCETVAAALNVAQSGDIITLLADTKEDITIGKDQNITLDLNGHNITNQSGDTITVAWGGTLTITGSGTVDNMTHQKTALYNNGTTVLNGGEFTRSKENGSDKQQSGGNSYYNILNHGDLTINAGTKVTQTGHYSSLIATGYYSYTKTDARTGYVNGTNAQYPKLTIHGGTFSGGLNTIKNDDGGILEITGGKFSNVSQAVFLNWNEAVISGGEFNATGDKVDGVILNGKLDDNVDKGKLEITGGTFTGSNGIVRMTASNCKNMGNITISDGAFEITNTLINTIPGDGVNAGTIEISGGTFSKNPSDYLADGYVAVEDGSSYTVGKWDELCAAALSATAAPGVTVKGMNLSGNVDMRTYNVTDATLQKDFIDLLEKVENKARAPIDVMQVKNKKDLTFANIKFTVAGGALSNDQHYYIQQSNPGLNYAYGSNAFVDNIKGRAYTGEELKNGLNFIVSREQGDIIFKIAPCEDETGALPEGAKTFTITNGVTFNRTDAPAENAPVIEVPLEPKNDGTTTTVTAEIKDNNISEKISTATAPDGDGKLVIKADNITLDVDKAELTLNQGIVTALAGEDAKDVTTEIKTPVGDVTLPAEAMEKMKSESSAAVLSVEKVATPVTTGAVAEFKVEVKVGGKDVPMSDLNKPITLSFFVGKGLTTNPTLVHVNGDKLEPILSSVYNSETGIITGTTDHLSTYAAVPAVTGDVTSGGIGRTIELTAAEAHFVTVQVKKGEANAIYTVKVPDSGKVSISVPTNCTVTVWETESAPSYTGNVLTPGTVIGTWTTTFGN